MTGVEGSRAGVVVCGSGCGLWSVSAQHNVAPPLDILLNQTETPLKSTETQKSYTDIPKAVQLILGAFKREISGLWFLEGRRLLLLPLWISPQQPPEGAKKPRRRCGACRI